MKEYKTQTKIEFIELPEQGEKITIDNKEYTVESGELCHPEYRFLCNGTKNDFYLVFIFEEEYEDVCEVCGYKI